MLFHGVSDHVGLDVVQLDLNLPSGRVQTVPAVDRSVIRRLLGKTCTTPTEYDNLDSCERAI